MIFRRNPGPVPVHGLNFTIHYAGLRSRTLRQEWVSCWVDGFDFGGDGAGGEAGADVLTGMRIAGTAQELAVGGIDQRVTTVEDGERRERVEARSGMAEPLERAAMAAWARRRRDWLAAWKRRWASAMRTAGCGVAG